MLSCHLMPTNPIMQMIIYFASNPDEELLTQDVAIKTGLTRAAVFRRMTPATLHGMIERVCQSRGRMRMEACYRAGPALLKMIGRAP